MAIYKTKNNTHCKHGHELTVENLYLRPSTGYRECRVCNKLATRAWKKENPEKARESSRRYNTKNHTKIREYAQARKARKISQMGDWSSVGGEDAFICSLTILTPDCHYCHNPLAGMFHVEHKTPLSRGGLHAPDNLTLACPTCNLQKGVMTEEEYVNMKNPTA